MADLHKLQELARLDELARLAKLVRYYILTMTTRAGSGHPTSSLSATDLMVALYFSKLRFDVKNPQNPNNDRVIFSKGHGAPLLYALWTAAGEISQKELKTYREFKSTLEGHPTPRFRFADVASGSLGQGLSNGLGMALAARLDKLAYTTYVLMGDSEAAEGSVWEAMEVASYYKLGNLVAILDINRLGQSRPTMLEWDLARYRARSEAFGWEVHEVDGHNMEEVCRVFENLPVASDRPQMILAKTVKGKGVSFLEDKVEWHGIALSEEELKSALFEMGVVDKKLVGEIKKPETAEKFSIKSNDSIYSSSKVEKLPKYNIGDKVATRKAYGETIAALGESDSRIVVLDGETSNSTFAKVFREKVPQRYFEMFIAEQDMVGAALGLARRGKIPFVSTFSVFFTRAFDQIRMSAISQGDIKFVGSHGGVSIGSDGPSQMGLEDIAMFRTILGSTVLCPSDANSTAKLVVEMIDGKGIVFLRTARPATEVFYEPSEEFKIGGSKTLRSSKKDKVSVIACGLTVLEAVKAADLLVKSKINIRVIDAYSIKPLDAKSILKCAHETNNLVITVEDHNMQCGLGDAVLEVFATDSKVKIYKMAVTKMPGSATPEEQYRFESIDAASIVSKVREILK